MRQTREVNVGRRFRGTMCGMGKHSSKLRKYSLICSKKRRIKTLLYFFKIHLRDYVYYSIVKTIFCAKRATNPTHPNRFTLFECFITSPRLPFLLLTFPFSCSFSYSSVPPHASLLSNWQLEQAPRVSRRLHPV